jgi:hypothetical protein
MMTRSELNQKIIDYMNAQSAEGTHTKTESDLMRNATWEAIVEVLVQAELIKEDKPIAAQPVYRGDLA